MTDLSRVEVAAALEEWADDIRYTIDNPEAFEERFSTSVEEFDVVYAEALEYAVGVLREGEDNKSA